MNILGHADQIVNHRIFERERNYGPFHETIVQTAKIASIARGKTIEPEDVYMVQVALKLAREGHSHKEDNLLDAVAYIGALNNHYEGVYPGKERSNGQLDPEVQAAGVVHDQV